jgi:TatD DNase family protein
MPLIDAHAHLSAASLAPVVHEVVSQLRAEGVGHVVLGGVDPADWGRQLELADRYPGFLTTSAGIHPWIVRDCEHDHLEHMFHELKDRASKFDLIGEVGFDFHKDNSESQKAKQIHWCKQQLELATSLLKPVVLHVVRGHDQMLHLLRGHDKLCGMVHAFSGSKELAEQYVKCGFVISVGGSFFRSKHGRDLLWLRELPFVIETDAPQKSWAKTDGARIAGRWIDELKTSTQRVADGFGVSYNDVVERCDKNLAKILQRARD